MRYLECFACITMPPDVFFLLESLHLLILTLWQACVNKQTKISLHLYTVKECICGQAVLPSRFTRNTETQDEGRHHVRQPCYLALCFPPVKLDPFSCNRQPERNFLLLHHGLLSRPHTQSPSISGAVIHCGRSWTLLSHPSDLDLCSCHPVLDRGCIIGFLETAVCGVGEASVSRAGRSVASSNASSLLLDHGGHPLQHPAGRVHVRHVFQVSCFCPPHFLLTINSLFNML